MLERMCQANQFSSTLVPPPCLQAEIPRSGELKVMVTDVVDAGHFWVRRCDRDTTRVLRDVMSSIANRTLLPLTGDYLKFQGTFCLAMFTSDGLYYRARIDSINMSHNCATVRNGEIV